MPLVARQEPEATPSAVTRAVYLHLRTDQKAAGAGKLDHLFAETGS